MRRLQKSINKSSTSSSQESSPLPPPKKPMNKFSKKPTKKTLKKPVVKSNLKISEIHSTLPDQKSEAVVMYDTANNFMIYLDYTFYQADVAKQIFQELQNTLIYDTKYYITIYGKKVPIPRDQTAYGDDNVGYTFSGYTVNSKPWTPLLKFIRDDIFKLTGIDFNACLVNYYKTGNNYIGYHKDSEVNLRVPMIVSVSFGATRKFYFKSDDRNLPVIKVSLPSGTACIIMDPTNKHWRHSVPKELRCTQPRINLTFRSIYPGTAY